MVPTLVHPAQWPGSDQFVLVVFAAALDHPSSDVGRYGVVGLVSGSGPGGVWK